MGLWSPPSPTLIVASLSKDGLALESSRRAPCGLRLRVLNSVFPALLTVLVLVGWTHSATAQSGLELDRVLTLAESRTGPSSLSVDWGAPGLWQRLLRLQTTASALYTTAHPDDEQGGALTYLSRGQGVRTSLLDSQPWRGGCQCDRIRAVRRVRFDSNRGTACL